MKKLFTAVATVAVLTVLVGVSYAADLTSGTVAINANVKTSCSNFTAGNLDLQIDPSTANPVYSTGNQTTIQCTKGTSFSVSAASAGAGGTTSTSGTLNGKLKSSGLNDIPYTLYFAPTFSGGGFGSATASALITGSGDSSHGANIAVAAAQEAQAGSYSDTVTLTISY